MPVPHNAQRVIACIWDFDGTLTPASMHLPIFEEYGVDPYQFWAEVDGLVDYHTKRGENVGAGMSHLLHLLAYVEAGTFGDLTNEKLKELGAAIELCPGMPEFLEASKGRVADVPEFARAEITVEHYVVSAGIRPMIEGSLIAPHLDGIWASSFVEALAGPGYGDDVPLADSSHPISHIGSVVGSTSKSGAIYEINKGVNVGGGDVNARMDESQRRIPLRNMIYVADGPSDVPVFSILNAAGGKTLGVYTREPRDNYRQVKHLQDQGRIQGMAEADYRQGTAAYLWLMESIEQIGYEIVQNRRSGFGAIPGSPGQV